MGQNYKSPIYPIWVVLKADHYVNIFATSPKVIDPNVARPFQLVYYDAFLSATKVHTITAFSQPFHINTFSDYCTRINSLEDALASKWGSQIAYISD